MMKPQYISTNELLDKAKEKTGSDLATAKLIDVSSGSLSEIRSGKNKRGAARKLSAGQAGILAELVGLPWAWVVANIELERSHRQVVREFWEKKSAPPAPGH